MSILECNNFVFHGNKYIPGFWCIYCNEAMSDKYNDQNADETTFKPG